MNTENSRGEIILYQTADGKTNIDVKLENETVWLTQAQMALLFDCSSDNIGQHLKKFIWMRNYSNHQLPKLSR